MQSQKEIKRSPHSSPFKSYNRSLKDKSKKVVINDRVGVLWPIREHIFDERPCRSGRQNQFKNKVLDIYNFVSDMIVSFLGTIDHFYLDQASKNTK